MKKKLIQSYMMCRCRSNTECQDRKDMRRVWSCTRYALMLLPKLKTDIVYKNLHTRIPWNSKEMQLGINLSPSMLNIGICAILCRITIVWTSKVYQTLLLSVTSFHKFVTLLFELPLRISSASWRFCVLLWLIVSSYLKTYWPV